MLKTMIWPGTFCTYISKVKDCIPVVRTQISFAITKTQSKGRLPYYQLTWTINTIIIKNKYLLNIYYVLGTVLGSLNAITHLINQIKFCISYTREKAIDTVRLWIQRKRKFLSGEKYRLPRKGDLVCRFKRQARWHTEENRRGWMVKKW